MITLFIDLNLIAKTENIQNIKTTNSLTTMFKITVVWFLVQPVSGKAMQNLQFGVATQSSYSLYLFFALILKDNTIIKGLLRLLYFI